MLGALPSVSAESVMGVILSCDFVCVCVLVAFTVGLFVVLTTELVVNMCQAPSYPQTHLERAPSHCEDFKDAASATHGKSGQLKTFCSLKWPASLLGQLAP